MTSCKACDRRYLGCHDRCKAYKEYKEILKQRKSPDEGEKEFNQYMCQNGLWKRHYNPAY